MRPLPGGLAPRASRFILPRQAARPSLDRQVLQATSRRTYATEASPAAPPPRGRLRFLRYLWRATYVSVLVATGYTAYAIYETRWPREQFEPGPNKKTLVILGTGWGSVALLKKLDTENYNVVVISPRNFFLFTPLLPSCPTGTVEHRSIIEPLRHVIRHKKAAVKFYEAEATNIDHERRVVVINDTSDIKGDVSQTEVPFDFLVVGVGAENATFGIPGVKEHACFLKEISDAHKIRTKLMDCIETAIFKDQTLEEKQRLLHTIVVGGGPTGVEFAAELQDFFEDDLRKWVPDIAEDFHVTLVEALPNVLPMFSKTLIEYTEKTLNEEKISLRTKTMVKRVTDKYIEAEVTKPDGSKEIQLLPYGTLIWATGNAVRPVIRNLMDKVPEQKNSRRGLAVNEYLVVDGLDGIWAVGDCAASKYAPTAQVASQQGAFLARLFNNMAKVQQLESEIHQLESMGKEAKVSADQEAVTKKVQKKTRAVRKVKQLQPFEYSHQGSLAYIGMERAVADISWFNGNFASGGPLTLLFWRSAYLSMCFSTRNRVLVLMDWLKVKVFGRDVSRE